MKCPKCKKGEMELGYAIKSGRDGCCRIAPLDTTVDYDHVEFDLVYKCTNCGNSDYMIDKDKAAYIKFIANKNKVKESLSEDFTMALKEMKPKDIRKLSWFVSSYREV